jgi:hypothetical protein
MEPYSEQVKVWPNEGRHILAQYDDATVIVYQAYRPSIGRHAVEHGAFGGDFSHARMSWIKPNFLWMMYRSGWGAKLGLRGEVLEALGRRELIEVMDVSDFVVEQRKRLASAGVPALVTPRERVYRPADPAIAAWLRLAE